MKKIILVFLVLKTAILFSQTEKEVINFIESTPNIVSFKNVQELNETLKKSLPAIKAYLKTKHENIEEYYTNKNSVKIEKDIVYITLLHKKGFENKLKLMNKKTEKDVTNSLMLGNASGKDGVIEIDTKSFHILKFLYYK